MALVDVYGEAETTTEGVVDVTHRRFEPLIFDLLPNGSAWDRDDPAMQATVAATATEFSRADRRANTLLFRELDPHTTLELLTDWEEMLGLPDCVQPETIEARRVAVLAKLLAQTGHGQGLDYWSALMGTLGYEIEWVEKGKSPMTCEDDCIDVLYDEEWAYVWGLVFESGIDDALLACIFGKQAQLETEAFAHVLWQKVDLPPTSDVVQGLACTTTGYAAAVGVDGFVASLSADLETWTLGFPPTSSDFTCVCNGGGDGAWLIAAGAPGVVFLSLDGASWTAASDATAVTKVVRGVSRGHADDAVVVAVGIDGSIFRSTDGGDTWTSIASPTTEHLYAVTCCAGAMIAVGKGGQILRSTNSGASWSIIVASGAGNDLLGVAGWGLVVVAVGMAGAVRRSPDGGLTWVTLDTPLKDILFAVTSSSSGRWTAAGEGALIGQSVDDGLTWVVREVEGSGDLLAACSSQPFGRAVVAGAGANLLAFVE